MCRSCSAGLVWIACFLLGDCNAVFSVQDAGVHMAHNMGWTPNNYLYPTNMWQYCKALLGEAASQGVGVRGKHHCEASRILNPVERVTTATTQRRGRSTNRLRGEGCPPGQVAMKLWKCLGYYSSMIHPLPNRAAQSCLFMSSYQQQPHIAWHR